MAEQATTDFTYNGMQRLLQEARYDQAITALARRIEAQPQDRMARLLLLLANVSQFGTSPFDRQIEELRFIADLSSNERHIVRQIFLVCFQHAERDGQTIQKIVYQRLIRRLMLNQPLDVSISEAREIEQSDKAPVAASAPYAVSWTGASAAETEPDPAPVAPRRYGHWDEYALIGAGAMILIVLFGSNVVNGRRAPLAQSPSQPVTLVGSGVQIETGADRNQPAVILAATFTDEPARRLIASQLGELNKAYARWSEADPSTSGTVSLKLSIEPAGKVAKVEEALSRLSEHRFLDVVVAEVRQWKIPLGRTKTVKISVPLIFIPAKAELSQLAVEGQTREPALLRDDHPTTHTSFALEEAEPPSPELQTLAKNETTLKPHTLGRLERDHDTEVAIAAASLETETEIARTAALKHEPRFAAEAIEKVGQGTRVTVLRKERDWIKVKVQTSGNVGYLRKENLAAFNSLR